MNSMDLIREIFATAIDTNPDIADNLKTTESLFEDKKDELLNTLPPDTREAFFELFEIDISLRNEYRDYGIALGLQMANVMIDVMRNPFGALNNFHETCVPVEQAEKLSIDRIDNYIRSKK